MSSVTAWHLNDDRFVIGMRDHLITVDQPVADGGHDTAPTPTELLVASLSLCVGFNARRYLARHRLPTAGLAVTADYTIGGRPARVTELQVKIQLPDGVPPERREALIAVASHCTVHNTLADPPAVTVALAQSPIAAPR